MPALFRTKKSVRVRPDTLSRSDHTSSGTLQFCKHCKATRKMNVAASHVQVLLRGGATTEITTKTYYCRSCRSLQLSQEVPDLEPGPREIAAKRFSLFLRSLHLRSVLRSNGILIVLTLLMLAACSTVPVTKRHQLDLVPSSTILPMSFNQYKDFLSKHKVIDNTPEAQMVQRVGSRIQKAVEQYFAQNNMSDRLKGYNWEFHLVDDKEANAWCMPGGKVVVYSGILPITQDENGLAVVLGHEISHAVAKHGDERMSQGLLAQMGGVALEVALAQKPAQTQQLFMTAYGAGAEVGVLLPYSRVQESEADHLGLIFMAMAGYDPRTAVAFWERMMQSQKGAAPPALLSDHPADAKRIEDIKKEIPEAMKYYKA